MKYFYVKDGSIVGLGDSEDMPDGFDLVPNEFGQVNPHDYFYADGQIEKKPDRPSLDAAWNNGEWSVPEPIDVGAIVALNPWRSLLDKLRGSDVWEAAFTASFKSLRAQSAWTLLYGTITSTNNIQDLAFAVSALIDAAPTFFPAEIKQQFKAMLSEVHLLDQSLAQILEGTSE